MKTENYPQSRQDNLVIQELENETLIYDLQKNEAFCLNQTSAFIWRLCDGKNTASDIQLKLKEEFKSEADEGFVWLALDQLKKQKLIETEVEVPNQYEGMTRRQVIRKVGLASLITLPVIASVISPTAAHAQSGCVMVGGSCGSPAVCCPGTAMTCNPLSSGGTGCCVPAGGPDTLALMTVGTPLLSPSNCAVAGGPGRDVNCNTAYAANCCPGAAEEDICIPSFPGNPANYRCRCKL